jgi:CO dehydrogenase maturation factor
MIAVAGKGGTGKTTVCGMLIEHLASSGAGHTLAVDADPNSNLNEVLGVEVETTLGDIRETMVGRELSGEPIPAGMTKQEYAEFMFGDALAEGDDYDLLVMGRTQGTGCYCYVNGVLKAQLDRYAGSYAYIVVDNEAGLEHISRGTLPHIDVLLLISDCSRRGVQAVGRISEMVKQLGLNPGAMKLIVNRAPGGVADAGVLEEIAANNLDLAGVLPQDETVYRYDCEGRPTAKVPDDNPVKKAIGKIISTEPAFGRLKQT